MRIDRVIIKNYRALPDVDVKLNREMNIIVGNNESGKSTFLEAIQLAMTGQLYGRNAAHELHPFLFNAPVVAVYLANLIAGKPEEPPVILIELYLEDDPALATWKGKNNSQGADCPGIKFEVRLNESYRDLYHEYIKNPQEVRALPVDYFKVEWLGFNGEYLSPRNRPLRTTTVDASVMRNHSAGAGRFVLDIAEDSLTESDRVRLSLAYRGIRDQFLGDPRVKVINEALAKKKGAISDKQISISLDATARSQWESAVLPHLNDIPITLVGKGEQNNLKIRLAIDAASQMNVILVEEPENHLSHGNLGKLIEAIKTSANGRQVIVTSHSSYVVNKLGIDSTLLFTGSKFLRLSALSPDTVDFFMKLPGHDTLRMLLADKSILVEGPSDELVVQKAYFDKHQMLPLNAGVEIISVRALAFKRFLEIAQKLTLNVVVVTDNDGNLGAVAAKYDAFKGAATLKICYSTNAALPTLEPQLLDANGRDAINKMLGKAYGTDAELLAYMTANKTEAALGIFSTKEPVKYPAYIADAVA